MGALTTYGTGCAPAYFAAGYVPQAQWYRSGLCSAVLCLLVWVLVGGAWWRLCGLW